jgi:hypothetical protein
MSHSVKECDIAAWAILDGFWHPALVKTGDAEVQ